MSESSLRGQATLAHLAAGTLTGWTRLDLAADLTEFPRAIFELADSLEILNLSGNRLTTLPDDLPRLHRLRVIFAAENQFTRLPEVLGRCPSLTMLGFKANRICEVPAAALPPRLRWLILTDNEVAELPAALGSCLALQKLMLAGNRLTRLPPELARCQRLELIRLSANRLSELPPWLLALPSLAWLAYAGNPCATPLASRLAPAIPWSELTLGERLGEGASGLIRRATWRGTAVAVKEFKGAITSDGLPADELAACLAAGNHPHLIPLHGRITGHPQGAEGLVLGLLPPSCATVAQPPSLESCTRDVYPAERIFSPGEVRNLTAQLAAVGEHLHARGILHGDLYGHNLAWSQSQGTCFLGDFGAASPYAVAGPHAGALQALEVLAFGRLLGELIANCFAPDDPTLAQVSAVQRACSASPGERPTFAAIRAAC